MRSSARALLRACVFACLPFTALAQSPVVVEAESGTLGANLTTGSDAAAGVNYITVLPAANSGANPTPDRTATYQVTFPAAGTYALYVRILAGPNNGNDDSFYVPTGFNTTASWSGAYNTSSGGATAPGATVPVGGSAGTSVWKWQRLTPQVGGGGGVGPSTWAVPDGALTQTFAWGSREDGLLFDKFAFGPIDVCYTVGDLDAGRGPTGVCPPLPPPTPPAYTRVGAPLATGLDKFLGSAWSPGNASLNFGAYWNQVTPENGGKWGSAEPTRGVFNFTAAHQAEAQARASGGVFKWHVLFWGNQQPNWMYDLPPDQQLDEIHKWLAAIAAEFPNIDQIDVVNEALHDPPDKTSAGNTTNTSGSGGYVEALGGKGVTGWDWIINGFTLARQYFPNSKLILNDYSITNSNASTTAHLEIVKLLQDRGLIDAIGIQAHAFEFNYNDLANSALIHRFNLARLTATGLPVYVTEFDIDGVDPVFGVQDDNVQLQRYKALFPVFWESPGVKGVTMWGYVQNSHWRNAQGAWLMYTNGAERPALQWLVKYVENKAPVVAAQTLSANESGAHPNDDVITASRFLNDSGFYGTALAVSTATQMLLHTDTFTDANGVWTGGLANYDGSNAQAFAFRDKYGLVTGNPVGKVVATDADADAVLSGWNLESDTSGQFLIDPATGVVYLGAIHSLDFEQQLAYVIAVSVSDGYTRSAVSNLTIQVVNANDNKPAVTAGQSFDIDGGAHNVVGAIEVYDPDDTHQVGFTTFSNFAIVDGNTNSVFRLRANNGVLEVARPLLIDWRRNNYLLTTRVSDGTNISDSQNVNVNLPRRVELCLLNVIRVEVPKATAPLAILLGGQLGDCRRPL